MGLCAKVFILYPLKNISKSMIGLGDRNEKINTITVEKISVAKFCTVFKIVTSKKIRFSRLILELKIITG